jgi:hypothetical protein
MPRFPCVFLELLVHGGGTGALRFKGNLVRKTITKRAVDAPKPGET